MQTVWRMEDGGQKEERRQKEGWKEGMKEGTTTYEPAVVMLLSSTLLFVRLPLQVAGQSREQRERGKREREGGRSGRQSSAAGLTVTLWVSE